METAQKAVMADQSYSPQPTTPRLSPLNDKPPDVTSPRKVKSLKLEEPLVSLDFTEDPTTGIIDLEQALADLEASYNHSRLHSEFQKDLSDPFSDELRGVLQEASAITARIVDREQLEPADTIKRLMVPVMDFTISEPEWMGNDSDSKKLLEWAIVNHPGPMVTTYPGDQKAYMQLQWIPFPSKLGRISLAETIDATDTQSCIELTDHSGILTSSDFVWKRPDLAILMNLEDEDILDAGEVIHATEKSHQPHSSNQRESFSALIRKRKQQANNSASTDTVPSPVDLIVPAKVGSDLDSSKYILVRPNDASTSSTLLANFVTFHNYKKRKLGSSSFFEKPSRQEITHSKEDSFDIPDHEKHQQVTTSGTRGRNFRYAPCPSLKEEGVPANIFAAISMPHCVTSWTMKLLPHLKIVERDFDRWNAMTWDRKSVLRSPVISALAAEADVIVSPSTGIIITSLIKAIQRPLPGHKRKVASRAKIEQVSLRYERMIILVSEANRVDESVRELTQSEHAAFAEFSGFVSGLDTDTQIYYIGGGEEILSRWLAYFITKYSYEAREVDSLIIESESTWEMMLRRAGMNVFAAQVILSSLKEPRGVPRDDFGSRGLARFINMSPEERIAKFGQVLGGQRVLRRVGSVLDSSWE
ncbi:hypothetical protein TruAng_004729 [Truncatella angustata]|nr:hypothetical protein TruAng_004729 [Truncatella angustata]